MYLGMYVVPTGIVCVLHDTIVLILKFRKFAKSLASLGLRCPEREMPGEANKTCIKKTPYNVITVIASHKSDFAEGEAHLCSSPQ